MPPTRSTVRRVALACVLALALCALTLPAAASAKVPTYRAGSEVVFRITTRTANAKRYGVFLTIAARRRTDRYGALKQTRVGTFAKMTNKGRGRFTWTTPDYTFPGWFMVETGTYYWQTSVTDCTVPGCRVLSRIRTFKVV